MTSQPQLAIEAVGLVKKFGDTTAIGGVDLAVTAGSVYGVLGPNGAGKTTTMKILATLLKPDGGSARVCGFDCVADPAQVRRRVSLTGQFSSVDDDLTGLENLRLLARLLGFRGRDVRARADEMLAAFGLAEAADKQVKNYSGGMRRRLDIAASLLVVPEVIFLDEPTTGLDPRSRNQVWDIVRALAGQGTTVLLTTQYLDEADQLADRIAVIDHGRVIAEGTSLQLKQSVGAGRLSLNVGDGLARDQAITLLDAMPHVEREAEVNGSGIVLRVDGATTAHAVIGDLVSANIPVDSFSLGHPSLDEVFMALTGRPAEEVNDEQ